METKAAQKNEVTHYTVNGEAQETVEKKLTVRVILTNPDSILPRITN